MKNLSVSAVLLLLFFSLQINAQDWTMKEAPLMTKWAEKVNPDAPLPEYPRPQMVRDEWMNLNGIWEYKSGNENDAVPAGESLSGKILVPYPVESALSGVMEHHERLWYRKLFEVPSDWSGKRVLLHFGAIDWESEIYINGTSLGIHKGGYDPFYFDITPYLTGSGEQELIVRVYDPTNSYGQARGKQTLLPGGIMYTCTSGIWQTVWLEPVEEQAITSLKLIPDIDEETLKITVNTNDPEGLSAEITAYDNGSGIATVTGLTDSELSLTVSSPKLWSPSSPFLYDLAVVIKKDGVTIDSVGSYFGMRKISLVQSGNVKRMFLNNHLLFQIGPLDQGFWPDGIYTAPTDSALRSDIAMTREMGYNMIRKHIKVEPMRWYYWTDKLGMLVWQDMPSVNSYNWPYFPDQEIDKEQFKHELERLIEEHISVPSIISWVLFNEGQGQHDTETLVPYIRELDPSRPVNEASGWTNVGVGDVLDVHTYPEPTCPVSNTMAMACGEYGGIGLKVEEHLWTGDGSSYIMVEDSAALLSTYASYAEKMKNLNILNGLSAAVYTEITDVETELNGMMTYDRIPKLNPADLKEVNDRLTEVVGVSELVQTSQYIKQVWKYTTGQPIDGWTATSFDDSGWQEGKGGFGTSGTPGATIGTTWNTSDIWMRREFYLGELSADKLKRIAFSLHHDESAELYINGVLACQVTGYTSNYLTTPINSAALSALKEYDTNVLAVHCHQTTGGQYIDAGIVNPVYASDTSCAFNPNPINGTSIASTSVKLSWQPGNTATEHKVYFGTSRDLSESDLVSIQYETSYTVNNLQIDQTYYWRIDEVGPAGTIPGLVWKFTLPTASLAARPYPANGSTALDTATVLYWTPGNFAGSHKLYFGPGETLGETDLLSTQADSFFFVRNLGINTQYFWRVDEISPLGVLNGTTWSFYAPDAGKASTPTPSSGATYTNTSVILKWKAGRYSNTHKLYFGLDSDPGVDDFITEQTETEYTPEILSYNTKYYWRIDEVYEGGIKPGNIWNFTTRTDPSSGIDLQDGKSINIFPNPVSSSAFFKLNNSDPMSHFSKLEICSAGTGRILYQKELSMEEEISVNMTKTGLKPGLYFIRLSGQNEGGKICKLIVY